MTKIQIRKVNGVPMARPKNPFEEYIEFCIAQDILYDKNPEWLKFEQSVTEHEAPGFEEGEAEGELIAFFLFGKRWVECNREIPFSYYDGNTTKQIWRIISTPEKVEVKEVDNWIRCEDRLPEFNELVLVYTKLKSRLTAKLKKDNKWEVAFGDRDNSYVTHWQPLPSPPTH